VQVYAPEDLAFFVTFLQVAGGKGIHLRFFGFVGWVEGCGNAPGFLAFTTGFELPVFRQVFNVIAGKYILILGKFGIALQR
jgi:hypothetical protein